MASLGPVRHTESAPLPRRLIASRGSSQACNGLPFHEHAHVSCTVLFGLSHIRLRIVGRRHRRSWSRREGEQLQTEQAVAFEERDVERRLAPAVHRVERDAMGEKEIELGARELRLRDDQRGDQRGSE